MRKNPTTDLELAARLARAGYVKSARAIVKRAAWDKVIVIELNRTVPRHEEESK